MIIHKYLLFLPVLFSFQQKLFSQPEITAVFTENSPLIDGILAEDEWMNAFLVSDFTQREPVQGDPVSERTEFYFLYDRSNLYVGIRCYQDPEDITAKELARDVSLGQDDRVQVILDTYLNGRDGYWFQIGPRGSIGDALVNENGISFNKKWDGLWEGKARIHEQGWDAELSIPFKTLSFEKNSTTWGIKLIRYIKKRSETAYWPPTTLDANKFQISDAGRITGLENISQGIGLDIVPYLTGGFRKDPDKGKSRGMDAGMDVFYQITPSLKLAATVNTDFAQTEVDEREINLTRFDLYFPEKRDFFLDGANYFNFGISGDYLNPQSTAMIPFFTRTIGLDSTGNPLPIRYGGKFTGQAGKWNIGLLHIKEKNGYKDPGSSVARISRNIGKQSYMGIITTHDQSFSGEKNSLLGFDLRLASSEVRENKNLIYNIYGLKSFTRGIEGDDLAVGTELNYPNDFLFFRAGYMQIGENFNPGLGFLPRSDIRNLYGSLGIGPRPDPKWKILQIKSGLEYFFIHHLNSGEIFSSQVDLNLLDIIFLSGDELELSSHYQVENLDEDFIIYDNFTIPVDKYVFWWHMLEFTSAQHRDLWFGNSFGTGRFYTGNRTDWVVKLGYKIFVPLYIGIESDRRYVNLESGDFIAQIWRFNVNVLFSPDITWYNFAQFDSESGRLGWQSRFHWIIKPGKEVFLVWNAPFMDPLDRYRTEYYDARLKIKYTLRF